MCMFLTRTWFSFPPSYFTAVCFTEYSPTSTWICYNVMQRRYQKYSVANLDNMNINAGKLLIWFNRKEKHKITKVSYPFSPDRFIKIIWNHCIHQEANDLIANVFSLVQYWKELRIAMKIPYQMPFFFFNSKW